MFFDRRNNYDDYYGPNTPGMEYSSAMSTASVILAFLSIFSSLMFYIAIPAGALSILFALLSRGRNRRIMGKCRIAILASILGITASVVTTVAAVYTVMTNPEMRRQLESTFNYYAQELEDDSSDSIPDDDDRANEYFNKYYGNGGSLPDDDSVLPHENGNALPDDGNDTVPDMDDIFSYWYNFGGSEPGGGSRTAPSGGEYI